MAQTITNHSALRAFLTLNEAAAILGCTRRFLDSRIADGEIAVFHPSSRFIRIRRTELERWIAEFTHGAATVPATDSTDAVPVAHIKPDMASAIS